MLQHNDIAMSSSVVVGLATTVRRGLPDLAVRFAEAMVSAEPVYGERFDHAERVTACMENLDVLLGALQTGDLDPRPHHRTGRRNAELDVPLESLLHLYRLAAQMVWREMIAACGDDPVRRDALLEGATGVWEIVDQQSAMVGASYRDAVRRIGVERTTAHAAAVETLFTGGGGDPAAARRSATTLGLGEGPLTALAHPTLPEYRAQAVESALRGRGTRSVWQTRGDVTVGAVAAATLPGDLRLPVPLALGPVVTDLTALGAALDLARLALRAAADPAAQDLVAIDDVLPGALLLRSPDLTERLVADVLGDVGAWRVTHTDLLETFACWARAGGDVTRTAEALYCHRNTVFNRLRRLQELTGRRLSDPVELVHLTLAVEALRLDGPGGSATGQV